MERIFKATEDGYYYYFLPKKAMGPTVKSAPSNHHDEVEGNPLLERRVGNDDSTCENCGAEMNTIERLCPNCSEKANKEAGYFGPDRRKDFKQREEWVRRTMYDVSISDLKQDLRESQDPAERQELEAEIARLQEMRQEAPVGVQSAGVRQPLHDDSGAATGLRRRPDYGESDSITSRLNNGNSKGASAQYVIALAATSRKEASKTATMYVTGIEWNGLKVASFAFGSDVSKAVRLPNLTARAVSKQLFAAPFEVKARPVSIASFQK